MNYRQEDRANAGTRRVEINGKTYLVQSNAAGNPLRVTVWYTRRHSARIIERVLWNHLNAKSIPESTAKIIALAANQIGEKG